MDGDAPLHPLGRLLADAVRGRFPPDDGTVTVLPRVQPDTDTVVAFTGHAVVACERPTADVLARGPDGYGGAVAPGFLLWLAAGGGTVGSHDVVLAANGRGGRPALPRRRDLDDHPRVRHARSLRSAVRVHGDDRGFVTLGRGLGGLTELSVEVAPGRHGVGRALLADALDLVDADDPVIAEAAPGNARSLRALLAAGFVPIGSAVHITHAAQQATTVGREADEL